MQGPVAGPVAIAGPNGVVQRVRVSSADSPESIEKCLRSLFHLPDDRRVLLLSTDGCVVPMGGGLLAVPEGDGAAGPAYRLQVQEAPPEVIKRGVGLAATSAVARGPRLPPPRAAPPRSESSSSLSPSEMEEELALMDDDSPGGANDAGCTESTQAPDSRDLLAELMAPTPRELPVQERQRAASAPKTARIDSSVQYYGLQPDGTPDSGGYMGSIRADLSPGYFGGGSPSPWGGNESRGDPNRRPSFFSGDPSPMSSGQCQHQARFVSGDVRNDPRLLSSAPFSPHEVPYAERFMSSAPCCPFEARGNGGSESAPLSAANATAQSADAVMMRRSCTHCGVGMSQTSPAMFPTQQQQGNSCGIRTFLEVVPDLPVTSPDDLDETISLHSTEPGVHSSASSATKINMLPEEKEIFEELRFWVGAAAGYQRRGFGAIRHVKLEFRLACRKHTKSQTGGESSLGEEIANLSLYDSSDQRISTLYRVFSHRGKLHPERLRTKLFEEYGLMLSVPLMEESLNRVLRGRKVVVTGDMFAQNEDVPSHVFASLWQRLMLGAVCRRAMKEGTNFSFEDPVELVEYCETHMDRVTMSEEQLLFRAPLRIPGLERFRRKASFARWVRTTVASADRMLRLGVKFFLHPIAVSEAITAARVGMTKIDRYNHQYFMSMEVYAYSQDYVHSSEDDARFGWEPPKVCSSVSKSALFIVATGNPNDQFRNWLLTVISKRTEITEDPLNFFPNDARAATQVLDSVYEDLEAGGRPRDYAADFLMYTIIDRAVREVTPICLAYGHRLRWLQEKLNVTRLKCPVKHCDEVSSMQLEMQELRQWINQLRGILKTLTADANTAKTDSTMVWNFGSHAEGKGKSILLFLSSTDASLEQSLDRLQVLHDLARNFLQQHQRYRESFMNNILLTLTVATAVFMPAQLLAGIYGTNFVAEDGSPGIPELKWEFGYAYFLVSCVGVILAGLVLAYCCLRRV